MNWLLLVLVISMTNMLSPNLQAAEEASENTLVQDTVEDLTLVASAGLGGAILGLSTLSFEAEPTQHFRHVLVGGSLGIIVGVAIIAWRQATKNQNNYEPLYQYQIQDLKLPPSPFIADSVANSSFTFFQWDHTF